MMPNHTPGPWLIAGMSQSGCADVSIYRKTANDRPQYIGRVYGEGIVYRYTDTRDANARLIAAAPDLLAAIEELVGEFDARSEAAAQEPGVIGLNDTGGIAAARAVIAKAKGE